MNHILLLMFFLMASFSHQGSPISAQVETTLFKEEQKKTENSVRLLYGQASYYANKFEGRKTANGEVFQHAKLTAACNSLPLGTWIKITNLRNGKAVVVRTNDRLHPKTKRLVDLTRTAAEKLGFIKSGLTRVKVEVLKQKP
ncbi:MAG: septal ring lytic transglycosylase RlpA family protein [Ferruginibacter sp.]